MISRSTNNTKDFCKYRNSANYNRKNNLNLKKKEIKTVEKVWS